MELEIQTAISLGNEKPPFLGLTEKALWKALMQANITGDTSTALSTFIAEFQEFHMKSKVQRFRLIGIPSLVSNFDFLVSEGS